MRKISNFLLGLIPPLLIFVGWVLADRYADLPAFKLPALADVVSRAGELVTSSDYWSQVYASMSRLAIGFVIGATGGLLVGFLMATSFTVTTLVRPVLLFFQSVAGIAWIPLAIIWFGFGAGPVIFVVANAVFFIVLLNTLQGARSVPQQLRDSVRTLGGSQFRVLTSVVIPGALTSVLVGLENGLAFAWRALIAAELIAASRGLGFITLDASTRFDSGTVIIGVFSIGVLWLALERILLRPLRRRTVERWGLVRTDPV